MSGHATHEIRNEETCSVCGKVTSGNRGYAHIVHEDVRHALCCPLCFDTFQERPDFYHNLALSAGNNLIDPPRRES